MMKWVKGIALITILLASSAAAQTPGEVLWTNIFGGPEYDQARDIKQTRDGGFVVVGEYGVYDSTQRTAFFVLRLNSMGDTLWTRIYDYFEYCEGRAILETPDSGFVLAGFRRPVYIDSMPWLGDTDGYVMRLNSVGDTLWTRDFGGENHDAFYDISPTSDGGYILAGESESFPENGSTCYIVKINSAGNRQWERIFYNSLAFTNSARAIEQTSDGGYIIAGGNGDFSGAQIFLIRTDSNGDSLWTRLINDTGDEKVSSVRQIADGGFVLAGSAWDSTSYSGNGLLIKIDPLGNQEWRRSYGGPSNEELFSLAVMPDGGYVMAGFYEDADNWTTEAWLVATNASGDTLWTRTYGLAQNDLAYSIDVTSDSNIVFAGYINYDLLTANAYVAKISAHTGGGVGCAYVPGDINGNGTTNGIDVGYGVNYFKGGPIPPIQCDMCPQPSPFYAAGDVNGNCVFNGIDVSFFVNYLKGITPALLYCGTCPPATR